MTLKTIYRSGRVMRWHQNPDMVDTHQTNAAHQWGVAVFILEEHPNPSKELIRAALYHDTGELIVGDLSWTFKAAHPETAEAHRKLEKQARIDMGTDFELTPQETAWLKWADRVEAYEWMMAHHPELADEPDWQDAAMWIRGNKPA